MRWILGIVVLTGAGCASDPDQAFDAGYLVHVIVGAPERPSGGLLVEPVVTLGTEARRVEAVRLGSAAQEIARFRAPRGRHSFSIHDRRNNADVRATIDVERELWLLVEYRRGTAKLTVFKQPPGVDIGVWRPLVPVPD